MTRITLSLDLTPAERHALECALYPGGEPSTLRREDAERWARNVLAWRLAELAAGCATRATKAREPAEAMA